MEKIEQIEKTPMSDDDIKNYLPNAKIIKYSELSKYSDIDQILPKKKDFAILLFQDSNNTGHWCAISKYNNLYEFFDPYGLNIDNELTWTDYDTKDSLGIHKPYLSDMFDKTNKKVIFNPVSYQKNGNDIQTCGRHCVFRILNLMNKNMNLAKYYKYMKILKNELNLPYDKIVSSFITK